jgi:tripartite ATP-independent transporter DctP family solute receptor
MANRHWLKRTGWVAALFLLTGLASAAGAADYKDQYKLSVVVGPKGPWGEAAQKFADLVRERTDERINIKCYFAGELFAGKQADEFLLLRKGVADFAMASTINWSAQVPEFNLFALPFMFDDYDELDAVKYGPPGRKLFELTEEKGVIALAWAENGFRELTNSVRSVESPEDLEGLRIRVVGSPIFDDIFRALGADPVNMNWAEAQTAFRQGTVEGQENPVNAVIIPYRLWRVHDHITLWHYAIDPLILGVSGKSWQDFTPEDRTILQQCAEEACRWEVTMARQGLDGDLSSLGVLSSNGMKVTVLTPEQRRVFREETRQVYEEWKLKIGCGLVNEAEKLVGER